jgi:hypothetical protein
MNNQYCIDFLGAVQPLRIRVTRPRPRVRIGALVLTADERLGFVQFIRVSPYWVEEKQGIQRAYIYSLADDLNGSWTDYVLLSDLRVIQ